MHNILRVFRVAFCSDYFHWRSRFLPIAVHGVHSNDLTIKLRFMYGRQQCVAKHIIPQVPGWIAFLSSNKAWWRNLGIATFSSMQTQPERTCRSLQQE